MTHNWIVLWAHKNIIIPYQIGEAKFVNYSFTKHDVLILSSNYVMHNSINHIYNYFAQYMIQLAKHTIFYYYYLIFKLLNR